MVARLLAVLLLAPLPALAQVEPTPVSETITRSFPTTIQWVNPPLGYDSLYTVHCRDGLEFTVSRTNLHFVHDPRAVDAENRTAAQVTATVISTLPNEIDRIKRSWKNLVDFRWGRYRPEADAPREHAVLDCTVYVKDDIHQMDVTMTWNPFHEKD